MASSPITTKTANGRATFRWHNEARSKVSGGDEFRHAIGTLPFVLSGYRRVMDEATAVLERLARIETLDAAGAPPAALLAELRALLGEAEAWSRLEGGGGGAKAVEGLRSALAREMITV